MKHTDLPWQVKHSDVEDQYLITGPGGCYIALVDDQGEPIDNQANAEFICRACNSHEELVEALTEARDYLNTIGNTLPEDVEDFVCNSVEDVEDRLSKAIAKADKERGSK